VLPVAGETRFLPVSCSFRSIFALAKQASGGTMLVLLVRVGGAVREAAAVPAASPATGATSSRAVNGGEGEVAAVMGAGEAAAVIWGAGEAAVVIGGAGEAAAVTGGAGEAAAVTGGALAAVARGTLARGTLFRTRSACVTSDW